MCAGFVTLHLVQASLPQLPNRVSLQTIKEEEQIILPRSTKEWTVVDVCVAAGAAACCSRHPMSPIRSSYIHPN